MTVPLDGRQEVAPAAPQLPTALRNSSITAIDQAISSVTNLIPSVAALVVSDSLAAFGTVALGQTAYLIYHGLLAATVVDLQLADDRSEETERNYLQLAATIGFVVAIVLGGFAMLFTSELQLIFVSLAVAAPGLASIESGRACAFSRLQAGRAVRIDLVWLCTSTLAMLLIIALTEPRPSYFFSCWCLGGFIAGVWSSGSAALHPSFRKSLSFFRSRQATLLRYLLEHVLDRGAIHAVLIATSLATGVFGIGLLRSLQLLFTPLSVTSLFLAPSTIPILSRHSPGSKGTRIVVASASALLVVVWLANSIGVRYLLMQRALPLDIFDGFEANDVALMFGLYPLMTGLVGVLRNVLKASRNAGAILRARAASSLILVVLATIALVDRQIDGLPSAFVVTGVISLGIWISFSWCPLRNRETIKLESS